jgi:hypothetical protein
MTGPVNPIIVRYAAGEISAMQAAWLFSGDTTVADAIMMLRQAGLPPPEPPIEQQRAEMAHARRVLGRDQG